MKKNKQQQLVGTWEGDPDYWTSVLYTIALRQGKFAVSAVDGDREKAKVSGVRWDGNELRFKTHWASNNWEAKLTFRIKRPGVAQVHLTYTDIEFWRKQSRASSRKAN